MKVNDTPTGKEIILSKAFDNRAKVLNIFYFIVFTLLGISVLRYINFRYEFNIGLIILIAGFMVVYLLAGYRFINKAVQAEKILIDKTTLTHSKTGFLNILYRPFQTSGIWKNLPWPNTSWRVSLSTIWALKHSNR
jgi:predicted membrane channel-forming protein YqfA (hemolysin III family)